MTFSFSSYFCFIVMGRTPFFRTSIELEHHFSNIERTRTCSFVGVRTRTPYFWLRTIEHRISNIVRPITVAADHKWFHEIFHFFAEWYETGEACQNAGNCSKGGPDMYWHMFTRKISKDSTKAEAGSTSLWFVILRGLTKFEAFLWNGIWVKTRHFRYSDSDGFTFQVFRFQKVLDS